MPIKLNTASGGGVILTGANTASDKTITVPADDGTMIYANSSGNVGIGTTSPGFKLEVVGGTNNGIHIKDAASATVYGGLFTQSASLGLYARSNHALTFGTNDTERARIDSSGNLLVGTTSVYDNSKFTLETSSAQPNGIAVKTNGNNNALAFWRNSTTYAGAITLSASGTAYTSASDYRLKENVQPMTGALMKVAALKPVTYTWKVDGSGGQGFIAHELAEVVPECVTGEKDAVNEDGSIKPQGIDTSFLVATLTAAIQEQQQMIETLQAKVAALEAK